ncbi:MAG: colanic acid biosynthesis acetyltransferase WcaF [Phycisphaeraceae bacterium]|nr:colanic acid biosynthesis acetyltransferase WcaF [Phycisphaeraceae bacterium]
MATLDVLIITYNEQLNLPHCLASLKGLARQVYVVDSNSTDRTVALAREGGATVLEHPWAGYAQQRNWALSNLDFSADWTLILDADEFIEQPLRQRLLEIFSQPAEQVPENGFFINRLSYFMDQPIRHCGFFPSWHLRLFKRGAGQYENRAVHEHLMVDGKIGYIREPMLHHDRRGLEHYIAKHNRYSTLEAIQLFRDITTGRGGEHLVNVSPTTRRNRWLKRHLLRRLPFAGFWRFVYMYILRRGFLDGVAGMEFCRFIGNYDNMVAVKLRYLLRTRRGARQADAVTALGTAAVQDDGLVKEVEHNLASSEPVTLEDESLGSAIVQMRPERSPWSFRQKVARAIWMLMGRPLFRISFHNWYGYRAAVLRLFGARIGKRVCIRPTVRIEIPWNLQIEEEAVVGDFAILYSLGTIHIGKRTIVSQYAHLCAGTHDYTDRRFPLLRTPIHIGHDVWIGADTWVGPGVTIGDRAVLGARASAYKNLPAGKVYVGNPARPIKERVIR